MDRVWTQLCVTVNNKRLDDVVSIMSMLDNGLMIEDYSDFKLNGMYGDLVDESILNADREHASVSLFVPSEKNLEEYVSFIRERLAALSIEAKIELKGHNEQDWENSWKQYYAPIPLGRITIVPAWQKDEYKLSDGEIPVYMDPGMAFGTGTHETTRLVIKLLDKYMKPGDDVLDVGTGSGILAICAAKLGAGKVFACDLDPVAVKVAGENVRDSGLSNVECAVSDLLKSVKKTEGGYRVVMANIVADIIMRLNTDIKGYMSGDGVYIISGIIMPRADEVKESLDANGFEIIECVTENDWCAMAVKSK